MTKLPRPCLGAWNPATNSKEACGEPAVGAGKERVARCPRHRAMHEANRGSPTKRGFDRQYQRDRAKILPPGVRVPCELRLPGCTFWADTADHVTPRSRGGLRSPLRPACKHCNSSLGNRGLDTATPRPSDRGAERDEEPWFPEP